MLCRAVTTNVHVGQLGEFLRDPRDQTNEFFFGILFTHSFLCTIEDQFIIMLSFILMYLCQSESCNTLLVGVQGTKTWRAGIRTASSVSHSSLIV